MTRESALHFDSTNCKWVRTHTPPRMLAVPVSLRSIPRSPARRSSLTHLIYAAHTYFNVPSLIVSPHSLAERVHPATVTKVVRLSGAGSAKKMASILGLGNESCRSFTGYADQETLAHHCRSHLETDQGLVKMVC